MSQKPAILTPDPWQQLQGLTRARVALGRAGVSLPMREVLRFGTAHAQARDAVHTALDVDLLANELQADGFKTLAVHSQAADRATYLRRPDYGRRLDPASSGRLADNGKNLWPTRPRLAIVVADGLSSLATSSHTRAFLAALRAHIPDLSTQPLVIATQARVALGDEIGHALGADQVVVLIGERPGLSSPDSLGLYLTAGPRPGLNDAQRNCISNVRPEGLPYAEAARKLAFLIDGARRLGRTGVDLKDDSDAPVLAAPETATPFPPTLNRLEIPA
ncbi:MAG: ethanolamine ammonia-lyase subunit EutC [Rhodocyclales bacterium GT-UBC]|nr:MAG: ethanolamine ammonia-lyase subunit EutC [Rhodocyclales bacterium GT-UBC]